MHSIYDTIKKLDLESFLINKNVSELAKEYYLGKLIPTDNSDTEKLLNLSLTTDSTIRPFYFWCLNEIINSADGALMEYVGEPARRYIERFPSEFLYYLDNGCIEKANWETAINYSGYYEDEETENTKTAFKNFSEAILKNCIDCNTSQKNKLTRFAHDCFRE
jgi:hypothetical protein